MASEMAPWLRACAVFPEDLNMNLSAYMRHLTIQVTVVPEEQMPSSGLCGYLHMCKQNQHTTQTIIKQIFLRKSYNFYFLV